MLDRISSLFYSVANQPYRAAVVVSLAFGWLVDSSFRLAILSSDSHEDLICYAYGWLSDWFGESLKAPLEIRHTPYFRNPHHNCIIWEELEYTTGSKCDGAVAKSCQPCEETGPSTEVKFRVSVEIMRSIITSWGNNTSSNAYLNPHSQIPALLRQYGVSNSSGL